MPLLSKFRINSNYSVFFSLISFYSTAVSKKIEFLRDTTKGDTSETIYFKINFKKDLFANTIAIQTQAFHLATMRDSFLLWNFELILDSLL